MPQRKQIAWAQLRVGLLVVISLIVLAAGIFFIGGQVGFLSRRYTLKTYFASAGGVREGAEVRLAGIAVGNVHKIQLSPYTDPERAVEVVMRVTHEYQPQIRSDSVATIETAGLLGDGFIDLTRGGQGQPVVPENGEVKSRQEADIKRIVQNANDVVSNLRVLSAALNNITSEIAKGTGSVHKLIYDQTFYNRLNHTTDGLDRLVARVENGNGTLGKFFQDETVYQETVQTLNHVNHILDDVQHGRGSMTRFLYDPAVYDDVHQLVTRASTLVDKVNQGQGTMGRLLNDSQLYTRINDTMGRMDAITARIEKGEGTLGKLSTDPTLFTNLNESSKSLRDFLTEFRKTPRKYLTLRVRVF